MIRRIKNFLKAYSWARYLYSFSINWIRLFKKAWHVLSSKLPDPPDYYGFSPNFINVNDLYVQASWQHLIRGYDDEEFIKEAIQNVRGYTMCSYDALISLAAIVRYLEKRNIEGDFIETGTWAGGSAALMAISSLQWGSGQRHFHLFDSFEGLPQPRKDKDFSEWMERDWGVKEKDCEGRLVPTGALVANQLTAEEAMFSVAKYPRHLVTFHAGWFQNTVPAAAQSVGPIALLRLDGDLYESTLICLRNLYPLVIKGGFVIIDDWGLKGCRLACEQYFNDIGINPFVHFVDGCNRYIRKE